MQTAAPHADYAADEPLLPLHETACRSLVILCIFYLVLGLIDMGLGQVMRLVLS